MALDKKCGCNCFGHPRRAHSTLYCKYLKKIMGDRGFVMTSRGQFEKEKR